MADPAPPDDAPLDRDQRPTLKTLAFMTGLAITTVSRALKDGPEIGEETRRRVQLLASQIGYRPNRAGVRLRTGKTNVISLILNTHEEVMGMVSAMIYGVSEAIAATPYHLVVTPYSVTNDALAPVRHLGQPDDLRLHFDARLVRLALAARLARLRGLGRFARLFCDGELRGRGQREQQAEAGQGLGCAESSFSQSAPVSHR